MRLHSVIIYSMIVLGSLCASVTLDAAPRKKAKAPVEKVTAEQLLEQAKKDCDAYQFMQAIENLEKYSEMQQKNKKELSDEYEGLLKHASLGQSMLDRVEAIAIIDSIIVGRDDFFRAYRLSAPTGHIDSTNRLPAGARYSAPTTVYVTENGESMIWSAPGSEGSELVESHRLVDGKWETPRSLGTNLNEGGNANYPFMMSDGVTLYYASDGDNSLGGYDIFITRNDGEQYLQPQNIGMPYNSPYDDYLLAIDELTGAGWWATDRNQIPDSLTVYVFMPQELRINYDVARPDLVDLAKVTSISATRKAEDAGRYKSLREKIAALTTDTAGAEPRHAAFSFALPGHRIYTSLSQFNSEEARRLMSQYLDACRELDYSQKRLKAMRRSYQSGSVDNSGAILMAETEIDDLRAEIRALSNEVVRAETSNQ